MRTGSKHKSSGEHRDGAFLCIPWVSMWALTLSHCISHSNLSSSTYIKYLILCTEKSIAEENYKYRLCVQYDHVLLCYVLKAPLRALLIQKQRNRLEIDSLSTATIACKKATSVEKNNQLINRWIFPAYVCVYISFELLCSSPDKIYYFSSNLPLL